MAHLWVLDQPEGWAAVGLSGDVFTLRGRSHWATPGWLDACGRVSGIWLARHPGEPEASWVLLAEAGADVRVNGTPITGGIRVVTDRDEIGSHQLGRVLLSTERLAKVEPFPGAEQTIFCPRCKQPIQLGTPAVRCRAVKCLAWHHQSTDLPCWTYDERCGLCPQPTSLDDQHPWTPEKTDDARS